MEDPSDASSSSPPRCSPGSVERGRGRTDFQERIDWKKWARPGGSPGQGRGGRWLNC